jgi:hypothetical protein
LGFRVQKVNTKFNSLFFLMSCKKGIVWKKGDVWCYDILKKIVNYTNVIQYAKFLQHKHTRFLTSNWTVINLKKKKTKKKVQMLHTPPIAHLNHGWKYQLQLKQQGSNKVINNK